MSANRSLAPLKAWLRRAAVAVVGVYLFICVAMFAMQRSLLFHPTADRVTPGTDRLITPVEVQADGVVLRGLFVPAAGAGPRPTLLYFGGNAEGVLAHAQGRRWVTEPRAPVGPRPPRSTPPLG